MRVRILTQVYVVTLQNIQFPSNFVSVNYDTNTSTSTHFSDTDLLSNQSESSCESTVNLNLKRKGINIVFLNIQGLCGKEMCKFSEVKSMLTLFSKSLMVLRPMNYNLWLKRDL